MFARKYSQKTCVHVLHSQLTTRTPDSCRSNRWLSLTTRWYGWPIILLFQKKSYDKSNKRVNLNTFWKLLIYYRSCWLRRHDVSLVVDCAKTCWLSHWLFRHNVSVIVDKLANIERISLTLSEQSAKKSTWVFIYISSSYIFNIWMLRVFSVYISNSYILTFECWGCSVFIYPIATF